MVICSFLCMSKNLYAKGLSDHEIRQVSEENKFVGKKKIAYNDIDGTRKEDDVYFILEKVDNSNYSRWVDYIKEQDRETRRVSVSTVRWNKDTKEAEYHKGVNINDGIASFKESLRFSLHTNVWIAYATRKNPLLTKPAIPIYPEIPTNDQGKEMQKSEDAHTADDQKKYDEYLIKCEEWSEQNNKIKEYHESRIEDGKDIEMVVPVLADSAAPITSHIGIARNYKYFHYKMRPHINLSMELHAFAATASRMNDPSKLYMVTKPAHAMRNIMLKSLKNSSLIWIGDEKERQEQESLLDGYALLEAFLDGNEKISADNFYFINYRDKKALLDILDAGKKAEKYISDHSSAAFIQLLMKEGVGPYEKWAQYITNQKGIFADPGFYGIGSHKPDLSASLQKFYNEAIKTQTEESVKSNIIKELRKEINDYIKKEVFKIIEIKKNCYADSKYAFYPTNLSMMVPLDNRDSLNWKIRKGNEVIVEFKRPSYFGSIAYEPTDNVIDTHSATMEDLPTVMIDLRVFESFWNR